MSKYVNINDSYTASGDGSEGNMYNLNQFIDAMYGESDTYYLTGVSTQYWVYLRNATIYPYDNTGYAFLGSMTMAYMGVIIYGGIFNHIELTGYYSYGPAILKYCYLNTLSAYANPYYYSQAYTANIYGCTIKQALVGGTVYPWYYEVPTVSSITAYFDYCYFECDVTGYPELTNLEYHNCISTKSRPTASATIIDTDNVTWDFVPGAPLPSSEQLTPELVTYPLFQLPSPPTGAQEQWVTDGIEFGLFGSLRSGFGSFYFKGILAEFHANAYIHPISQQVQFYDDSDENPTSWLWDFGDGHTSIVQNPAHTYSTPGNYTVTLTASNADSTNTEIKPDYIFVYSVDFSGEPISGLAELSVQFTDLSSGTPLVWLWNFGDGETSTVQNPLHVYRRAGRYNVTLTVGY